MPVPPDEITAGDLVAVCDRYLPLVRHAVTTYAFRLPGYVDVDDLTGAAILGLVEAARRFDPERGVPFEAWALQRVRGAILDAARSADFASRRTRSQARAAERAAEELAQRLGRTPTDTELTEELGISTRDLTDLRARVHQGLVLSLDGVTNNPEDGSVAYAEVLVDADLPPLEALERRELDAYVRDCVAVLPERLRWIVTEYFFTGRTSADLAAELGVTESRISQLRSEALRLLRSALGAQYDEIAARTGSDTRTPPTRKAQEIAAAAAARSTYSQRLSPSTTRAL